MTQNQSASESESTGHPIERSMERSTGGSTGQLVELTAAECWELLRGEPVGRLAWNGPEGPTVQPVNFAVSQGGIEVKTTAYSAVAHLSEDSFITFQVDRIDSATRTGWSVLARGQVTFDWTYGRVEAPGVDVWPGGERALRLHLEVATVSGRRLTP